MEKWYFKCDDFTAHSSDEMAGYILSQCSAGDIITTWFNLSEDIPALYNGDIIIGCFHLGDLLVMYRNNILADKIYDTAFDYVDDWLTEEIYRASVNYMPMLDISVNINHFHIDLTWED